MALRVLVVAAGTMAQAGMAALLESVPGLEVAGSMSPTAAMDIGGQVDPDICLLDVERPADVEAVVAQLVATLPCPVVAVTETEGFAAARTAGAMGVVSPSIPAEALRAALEAARLGVAVTYPPQVRENADRGGSEEPGEAPPRAERPVEALTARERQVLVLMADGLTNQGIATRLAISEHTAKFHVSAVLGKLGAQSRAEAVTIGYRLGLVSV